MKKRLLVILTLVMVMSFAVSLAVTGVWADGYALTPGDTVDVTDAAKLYEDSDSNTGNAERFADNANYYIYKFSFGDSKEDTIVNLTIYNTRNCAVWVSSDLSEWKEIYYADGGSSENFQLHSESSITQLGSESDDPNKLKISICMDEYLSENGDAYLKFGAHDTAYGWGASLRNTITVRAGIYTVQVAENGSTKISLNDPSQIYDINGTNTGESNGTVHRYADNAQYFTYKVKFADGNTGKYLRLFYKGTNRALYISSNENFSEDNLIGSAEKDASKAALCKGDDTRGYYCIFSLDNLISAEGDAYIKFAAEDTSSGNGADVFYLECIDGEALGQSTEGSAVDMCGNDMVTEVSVTDFGINALNNAGLLVYNGEFALSAKNQGYIEYKISVPENVDPSRTYIRVRTGGSLNAIEAKTGETGSYATIGTAGANAHGAVIKDGDVHYYSLTSFTQPGECVYLRFSSSENREDGGESFLLDLTVYANRTYEDDISLPQNYTIDITSLYAGDKEVGYFREDLSYRANTNNMDDAGYRYYDAYSYGVYELDIDKNAAALLLVMDIRGGYRISVSDDAKVWKDIVIGEVLYVRAQSALPNDFKQANVTQLIDASKGKLYIKIADATTDGGWGGAFTSISLMTVTEESAATETPVIFGEGKLNVSVPLYDPRLLHEGADATKNAYLGREIVGSGSFSYCFELPANARSFYIAMRQSNLSVSVSTDGQNYSSVPNEYVLDETNGYGSMLTYNLAYLLQESKTVYVRFAKVSVNDQGILYSLYAGYNVTENAGKEYENRTVQAFLANEVSESKYLYRYDYTQMGTTNKYKEFNRTSFAVYKFSIKEGEKAIKLIASIGNSFVLSVSADDVTYYDVVISDQQYYGNNHLSDDTVRDIYIDITEYIDGDTVYVKVTDLIDDNDCGAQLRGLGIITMSGEEVAETGEKGSGCSSSAAGASFIACSVLIAVAAIAMKKRKA